ncbi:hypothetical protein Fmac_028309 [Flemingia macrophylla]|uniref:Chromo domain-containing protein n=1 Tax=Flemingia macrophylla TaxID=520843 RepID=A0ABD1L8K1_9FABA
MKRKPTSEAPNEVVAPSDLGVEDGGGVQVENFEGTQLRESASEEPRVEDSEEEDEEENEGGKDAAVPLVAEGGQQPLVLAENFYEVEAIRRKRVRKGQLQYYIKWRDWPETANTWEPPENLESVPDVIEAFEESLKSGKHRKRRRKHVVHHHTQPKKRLERSTTPYSLRRFSTKTAEKHTQSAPLNDPILTDVPAFPQTVLFSDEMGNGGDGSGLGKSTDCNANKAVNGSEQNIVRNEENDYDPKLSELKAMGANGNDTDKLAIQFPEDKISPGSNCQTDGIPKGDCSDTVRGSKRRKSGSVKRFKKESHTGEPANTVEQEQARNPNSGGGADHANPASNIVRIIRPIGYSTSVASGMQDVLVTFVASRSDGKEVMINNDQLKKINPILLINFYEQHLRYSPTS